MIEELTKEEFNEFIDRYGVAESKPAHIQGKIPAGAYAVRMTYRGRKGTGYLLQRRSATSNRYLETYYLIDADRYAILDEGGEVLTTTNNGEMAKSLVKQFKRSGIHASTFQMF